MYNHILLIIAILLVVASLSYKHEKGKEVEIFEYILPEEYDQVKIMSIKGQEYSIRFYLGDTIVGCLLLYEDTHYHFNDDRIICYKGGDWYARKTIFNNDKF